MECLKLKKMHSHHHFSFIYIIIRSSVDSKDFGSNLSIIDPVQEVQRQSAAKICPSQGTFVHKCLSVFELP